MEKKAESTQKEPKYIICPFDKNHKLLPGHRYQHHIDRCRKQNAWKVPLKKCPYNASHLIPTDKFEAHKTECPDGKTQSVVDDITSKMEKLLVLPVELTEPTYPLDEDWDADPPSESYDPLKATEQKNILRPRVIGVCNTKKIEHKLSERARHRALAM